MSELKAALATFFQHSDSPVLFSGAGVSARAGLPTWDAYMKALAGAVFEYDPYTKFMIDEAVKEGRLEAAASYYKLCPKMPEATKLRELVAPLDNYEPASVAGLLSLPFRAAVTTNFDRVLHDAYALSTGGAPKEVNIDDPTLDSAAFQSDFYIARIHGRVEVPGGMRLTADEFQLLAKNPSYYSFLDSVFTRRQVLFVGYSFLDPAISAVLKLVRARTRSMHGQEHLALIPDDASADLVRELESLSVRRVTYDPRQNHKLLWDQISEFASDSKANVAQIKAAKTAKPFESAKKYLATTFARMSIGGKGGPLVSAMVEGIVSGMLEKAGPLGATEEEMIKQIEAEMAATRPDAAQMVATALFALVRDKVCSIKAGAEVRYVRDATADGKFDRAISRLVEGASNRYQLRERGVPSERTNAFLSELFVQLLLRRGWDLGAAFASRRMPEEIDVMDIVDIVSASHPSVSANDRLRLARSVEDLLTRPDDAEADLLADLGRLAFGLELVIEAPRDALFYQRTLPDRIYFDANVLMPAITEGHPHYDVFSETVKALRVSSVRGSVNVSLCVCSSFLNEIVSHRQLAIDLVRDNGGEGLAWAEREAALFGTANVNVFIGAYLNARLSKQGLTFEEFLTRCAPFRTEPELKRFLERFGFQVVSVETAPQKDGPGILHRLEVFYANQLEKGRKSGVVIQHDAKQLALLNADIQSDRRSLLVTADRRLRDAVERIGFGWLSSAMITHLGLAQLVELLVGGLGATRSLASLLWMSEVSSDAERLRNFLLNKALEKHDVAMAMGMTSVVDAIVEDAIMELEAKKLELTNDNPGGRSPMHKVLERYEADFFKKMKAEAIKRGLLM